MKDTKTEFLNDLQALLKKHGASFMDFENYKVLFYLNGRKECITFDTSDFTEGVNAHNLFERTLSSSQSDTPA